MTRLQKSTFRRVAGLGVPLVAMFAFGSLVSTPQAQGAFATIVDSKGFELPKFDPAFAGAGITTTGQLEGQAPFPEPLPVGTWLRSKAVNNSLAVVENTVFAPGGGTQGVKVDREAVTNGDQRWAVPVSGWPSLRYVCIDWDMRVKQTATVSAGQFGPFFGVEAYDDDAVSVGVLGTLGVDSTTGEVLYQDGVAGDFVAGPIVAFNTWNHFNIVLDYVDHDYEAYVNNVLITTEEFVDQAEISGGLNNFTDADISTLAAAGDAVSRALGGTAYFDNFKVLQSSTNPCANIPEPGSLALAGLGLAALQAERRRK